MEKAGRQPVSQRSDSLQPKRLRNGLTVWGIVCASLALTLTFWVSHGSGGPGSQSPSADQEPLDPFTVPKFAHELPIPRVFAPTVITDSQGQVIRHEYTVSVGRTTAQMLPPGFPRTTVMAFGGQVHVPGSSQTAFVRTVPGPVFENTRGIPTRVHWRNEIDSPHFLPVDPTLHFSNPNTIEPPMPPFVPFPPGYDNAQHPVGWVTHTHGLVVRPGFDGTAEEWFTRFGHRGPSFESQDYDMPNEQAPTQLFYHDHTMGVTRVGVYSGIVGAAYFAILTIRLTSRPRPCRKESSRSRSSSSTGPSLPTGS